MSLRPRPIAALAAAVSLLAVPFEAQAAPEPTTPKNIILLISDGAGYNQFDAVNFYETGAGYSQVSVNPETGAIERIPGKAHQIYESFPVQVAQSNYSANGRAKYVTEEAWEGFTWTRSGATDSAAAGTALGTGVKTKNGVLGHDAQGERLVTVGEQAKKVGKGVGLVTSVPFNHATPAGFIAHSTSRSNYQDLATEMIDSGIDVIMGGGHPNYDDNGRSRVANYTWISQQDFNRVMNGGTDFTFIDDRSEFEALATTKNAPEKIFGLAQVSQTLQYNRQGLGNKDVLPFTDPAVQNVPTLATMTKGALNVLQNKKDGFFLMVEGGAVDWAGHGNQSTRLIEEQLDFNASVNAVVDWVEKNSSWDETLVMVTADHETGYLTGQGSNPGWSAVTGEAGQLPKMQWNSGNHTNTVVPFYAKGAGSERLAKLADEWDLVRGAYLDNTEIGQTIFDFIGHAPSTSASNVAVQADVPVTAAAAGALSMSVQAADPIVLRDGQKAKLPQVVIIDTRNEVQAKGKGWNVVGSAADFTAGNRVLKASALSWSPSIVQSKSGASAGKAASFGTPLTLASANRTTRVGETVADAELGLTVPAGTPFGNYGTEITLSLFAQD